MVNILILAVRGSPVLRTPAALVLAARSFALEPYTYQLVTSTLSETAVFVLGVWAGGTRRVYCTIHPGMPS
jgi:hypothetical protein